MDSEPSDQGSDMDEAEHHEEDGELECKGLKSGSVEQRGPIKRRMVFKSGSDPLHSV
nr:hypothetical protein [Tanacetum cinerariifolium]